MEAYIKKHTIIFCLLLIFIIAILIFSYFLTGDNLVDENSLYLEFDKEYVTVTKSDDLTDAILNEIKVVNPSNQILKYNLYLKGDVDLTKFYYKMNDGRVRQVDKDGNLYHGSVDAGKEVVCEIGILTNDKNIKSTNLKFEISQKK